jgi:two-component system chemotaxis response regulator CheY
MPTPLSLLLIEDDDADRDWVERNLKSARILCQVDCASSGEEALALTAKARAEPYDVVLVDFGLPDVDPMDLLHKLAKQEPLTDTLIIALSGSRDSGLIHAAMDLGVHAFMNKPFSPQALMDTLTDSGFWLTFKRPA